MKTGPLIALGGLAVLTFGALSVPGAAMQTPDGHELFMSRCNSCHGPGLDRAPTMDIMAQMSSQRIMDALEGAMSPFTEGMTPADKQAIATYVSTADTAVAAAPEAQARPAAARPAARGRGGVETTDVMCESNPPIRRTDSDWFGAAGGVTGHRYQANPGFDAADVSRLKVKWTFSISPGNAQPSVIGDWMWLYGSGALYALDTQSGCVRWRVDGINARTTAMPVETSISPSGWAVVLGQRNRVVKAFDAATGQELWASETLEDHRASGITGSIIVAEDQVFVPITSLEEAMGTGASYRCCTFRGSLVALDLATGETQWKTYVISEPMRDLEPNASGTMLQGPAGAAIWSQPTVDLGRRQVYVATGDSYTEAETIGADAIMAIDMETGRINWQHQVTENDNFIVGCTSPSGPGPNCPDPLGPDYDFGASPILFDLGGGEHVVLSGQKSGITYGMDPDTGELLWEAKVGGGGALGGIEWGVAADTERFYAGSSDIVSLVDELLRPLGQQTMAFEPEPANPGLAAIDPATGDVIWRVPTPRDQCFLISSRIPHGTCAAGNSGAPAAMPGAVFAGSTDGWFRAYDAETGEILWKFATVGPRYSTTNGVEDQPGGGIDGAGPTIAQGMVFITSGFDGASNYGSTGTGRNVLIAFSVDGE